MSRVRPRLSIKTRYEKGAVLMKWGRSFWRLKHELGKKFALGAEGYSEIEDLAHAGTFDDQKHRLGPVA